MKTIVTITIEHPAPSAGLFIDTALRPYISDMNSDIPDDWTVSLKVEPTTEEMES